MFYEKATLKTGLDTENPFHANTGLEASSASNGTLKMQDPRPGYALYLPDRMIPDVCEASAEGGDLHFDGTTNIDDLFPGCTNPDDIFSIYSANYEPPV
jgi:hypothetical protein